MEYHVLPNIHMYLLAGWVFMQQKKLGLEGEHTLEVIYENNNNSDLAGKFNLCHLLPFAKVEQYTLWLYLVTALWQ